MWIRIQIQDFDEQKLEKVYKWIIFKKIFDQKLQIAYPYASIKDVQASWEAFIYQKITSSTSKHEISSLLRVIFALLELNPTDQN